MPVRIYDISKKLGLENKEVLSKAKELGIAAARVASSSLDKITAEYLEQQLVQAHPRLTAPPVPPAAPPAVATETVTLASAQLPEPQVAAPIEMTAPAPPVALAPPPPSEAPPQPKPAAPAFTANEP